MCVSVCVAVIVVAVVVYFECIDFVVLAAGIDVAAVNTLFIYCIPAVVEIAVVVAFDDDLR